MKVVGIGYHASLEGTRALAERLVALCEQRGVEAWMAPLAWDAVDATLRQRLPQTDLLVCVGGDGTVLHAADLVSDRHAALLGVRMGRLGFLSEATEAEAADVLSRALDGQGRVEQRSMVQARIEDGEPVHALNDVVIGRATLGRTISVGVRVDEVLLAEYRADGVIVCTATGSTGYALSAGGPILHPSSPDLVLIPVAPHLSRTNPLVLPGGVRLSLEVARGYDAVLAIDGGQERSIVSGSVVHVSRSPRSARFLRLSGESRFYAKLADRLGWLRRDHVLDQGDEEASQDG